MRWASAVLLLLLSAPGAALAQEASEAPAPTEVPAPAPADAQAPAEATPGPREAALEQALRFSAHTFDAVSFLAAERNLITGIFESYCAARLLAPPADALDIGLGVGCLVGATTLLVLGIRGLVRPRGPEKAQDRLMRFYTARRDGDLDLDHFEAELAAAAVRARRRRWVTFALGVAELAATAVVATFTARGDFQRSAGTTVAVATGIIGVMGITNAFIEAPVERAWTSYSALGPQAW